MRGSYLMISPIVPGATQPALDSSVSMRIAGYVLIEQKTKQQTKQFVDINQLIWYNLVGKRNTGNCKELIPMVL